MTTSEHKFFLVCAACGQLLMTHEMSLIAIQSSRLAPGEVARRVMIAHLQKARELYLLDDCPVCASCSDTVKKATKLTAAVNQHLKERGEHDTSREQLDQLKLVCTGVLSVLEDSVRKDSEVTEIKAIGHAVETLREVLQ